MVATGQTAERQEKGEKTNLPFGLTVHAASLLRKHKEPDGWDAVHCKATVTADGPDAEDAFKAMTWDVLAEHGLLYWKSNNHHNRIAGAVDAAKVKKRAVDLDVYLDLQHEDAQQAYDALLSRQPLQVTFPGKWLRDASGKVTKAVGGSIVISPAEPGAAQFVQYDDNPQVRAKAAEAEAEQTAEKWQEQLDEDQG